VFDLYVTEKKIGPEAVENMRTWPHSGFSVDQLVYLPAGDRAGIERLIQYMTRCPFSLSRLVHVNETGKVIYKAEKDAYRRFPEPQDADLASGAKRNFQIFSPLEFLAEFTQHIPPKCSQLIRYYGSYTQVGVADASATPYLLLTHPLPSWRIMYPIIRSGRTFSPFATSTTT